MNPDLKLQHLMAFQVISREPRASTSLEPVAAAYAGSITNLFTLSFLLPMILESALFFERAESKALLKITGSLDRLEPHDPRSRAVRKHVTQQLAAKVGTPHPLGPAVIDEGVQHLTLATGDWRVAQGVRSYMAAMVLNVWTAFEVLAGDLWEAALNAHPRGLSDLKGSKSRIAQIAKGKQAKEELAGGIAAGQERAKTVPLTLIQSYDYDLHKHMGSILRGTEAFDSLDGIRSAYSKAFFKDCDEIDAALSAKYLDSLSEVRNLIAHKGGRIDQKYCNVAESLPNCPLGRIGDTVLLNGELVARLGVPVLECGLTLIASVDKWITSHPSKTKGEQPT